MTINYALGARNAKVDAFNSGLNGGMLRIYGGTKPASPETAISGQTLLAELTFNATAAPAASGGSATYNAITQDSSANNGGTATWARLFQSNGTTPWADLDVSASGGGGDLQLANTTITVNVPVQVTSFSYSQAM
jgi:hypothetical protein